MVVIAPVGAGVVVIQADRPGFEQVSQSGGPGLLRFYDEITTTAGASEPHRRWRPGPCRRPVQRFPGPKGPFKLA
jgi:hypothetical protein